MTSSKRIAFVFVLFAVALAPLWTARVAAQSARAKEVGLHIKCMCKGCDMTAGGCAHPGGAFSGPCDSAKAELRQIDDLLAQGKTEQQIIDAFVAQYGTIAYVEPPKHGFGLVAWVMPFAYFLMALSGPRSARASSWQPPFSSSSSISTRTLPILPLTAPSLINSSSAAIPSTTISAILNSNIVPVNIPKVTTSS